MSKFENTSDSYESSVASRGLKDDLLPPLSNHQRILISVSSRCSRKGIVCEQPHFMRIKFYGSKDKPLGKFLKDSLFNVVSCCGACVSTCTISNEFVISHRAWLDIYVTK